MIGLKSDLALESRAVSENEALRVKRELAKKCLIQKETNSRDQDPTSVRGLFKAIANQLVETK